jgi:hypothetical protein
MCWGPLVLRVFAQPFLASGVLAFTSKKCISCERVNCGALLASLTITPWPFSTPVTVADSEREATLGEAQWRAHQIACLFGEQAPAPMSGEDVLPYRKRLLRRYVRCDGRLLTAAYGTQGE